MKQTIFIASLMSIISVGVNAESLKNETLKAPAAVMLGSGFSSLKQTTRLPCYIPSEAHYAKGGKAILGLSNSTSFDDIEHMLHTNISAHGMIGAFSGSASADYLRDTRDTRYSQSFYYKDAITFPMEYFTPSSYGNLALSPLALSNLQKSPEAFSEMCGNQFIQGIVPGANLLVTLKLDFKTTTDKQVFSSSVSGGLGINSASSSIQKTVKEKHIQGTISVLAYQEGGDPTRLANIFKLDTKGHYYITTCSLDNLDACTSAIDGFIDYAKNDFPNQLSVKDGKVEGSAYPVDFHYENYTTFGVDAGKPVTSPEIVAARNKLGELLYKTEENLDFVTHYLHSVVSPYLLPDAQNKLESIAHALDNNLAMINSPNDGAIQCYSDPTNCVATAANIESNITPIDQDTVNYFKNTMWTFGIPGKTNYYPIDTDDHFVGVVSSTGKVIGYSTLIHPTDNGQHLPINYLDIMGNAHHSSGSGLTLSDSGLYSGIVSDDLFGTQYVEKFVSNL
ncbi:hypothetical protein L4C34_01640 [Vibrio profundum]|uniref:hypothetical protein n=1 Tax=Vibrio profundum TaxID=2910247 RepID=UPI003D148E9D